MAWQNRQVDVVRALGLHLCVLHLVRSSAPLKSNNDPADLAELQQLGASSALRLFGTCGGEPVVFLVYRASPDKKHIDAFDASVLSSDSWFRVASRTCQALSLSGSDDLAAVVSSKMLGSDFISTHRHKSIMCYLHAKALCAQGRFTDAQHQLRPLLFENCHTRRFWNIVHKDLTQDASFNSVRAYFRLLKKNPNCFPGYILQANHHLSTSYFINAVDSYSRALALDADDRYAWLCMGIAFLRWSRQRTCENRHEVIVKAFGALCHYRTLLVEDSQEALYNMGRAFHELGLAHMAVPYYEKVLKTPLFAEGKPAAHDMRREAAYNLSAIYKASGSADLARAILRKHCTF
eukprot:m.134411 g.134411  ORF g.134411 m.134411 type:complete len:349 (-) comp16537_c0_seq19:1852-2898(-)